MEHVSGETLHAALSRSPVPPKRALEIASEVAEALEEAHKKRVVHRDLKPANVMVTEQGHVKVMDFGLAKQVSVGSSDDQTTGSLTDPGTRIGTPGYMAPEQLLGSDQPTSGRTSLPSVCCFTSCWPGRIPFKTVQSERHDGCCLKREPAHTHSAIHEGSCQTRRWRRSDRLLAKELNQIATSRSRMFVTDLRQLLAGGVQRAMGDLARVRAETASPPSGRTPYVGREAERG